MKASAPLIVNRSHSFAPEKFIGSDWSVWRGPADGTGLEGEIDQDSRALTLIEIDFSKVQFIHTLRDDERWVRGEDNLLRLKARKDIIPLDAAVVQALYEEKDHATLEWLRVERNITWFACPGTVLRDKEGFRYMLGLYWTDNRWPWYPHWLENNLRASRPSAVIS